MIHLANYRQCIIGLSVLLSNYNIIIPVVIGNLGMIRKTNDKLIKQLPGA